MLGAAFALKPIPGLFFLYFLWRREWRLVAVAGLTLVVLSAIGVALSGIEGAWLWATVNYPSHASVWPGYPDNGSVRGFFTRIFGPSDWKRPLYPLAYASMVLWVVGGAALTGFALLAARPWLEPRRAGLAREVGRVTSANGSSALVASGAQSQTAVGSDVGSGVRLAADDLEIAVLTVLSLLVTPIVWPHYYVVLVMPIAVSAVALAQIVVHRNRQGGLDSRSPGPSSSHGSRRLLAGLALTALAIGTVVLSTAHYVEPYAGNGGQQLSALVLVFGASLAALWWTAWP